MPDKPTHRSWKLMHARCADPSHHKYHLYGGRGIKVCEAWHKFSNFLKDMGARPEGHTIDRKDANGDYEPGNCRWATTTEQNRNKRTNKRVEYRGNLYTAAELMESFPSAVNLTTLIQRIGKHKWDVDDALSLPAGSTNPKALQRIRESATRRATTVEYEGRSFTMSQLADLPVSVVDAKTIAKRLNRGWLISDALTMPPQKGRCQHTNAKPILHTEETKEKLRAIRTGMKFGPMSDEHKRAISASLSGRKHDAESIEKMRQAKMGHEVSDETRNKLRTKLKGRVISEETKQRMRLAQQKRRLKDGPIPAQ